MQISALQIPLQQTGHAVMKDCICWEWRGQAWDQGDQAAAWLSSYLSMDVRLVRYAGRPCTIMLHEGKHPLQLVVQSLSVPL